MRRDTMRPERALRRALISCTNLPPGDAGIAARALLEKLPSMGLAIVPVRPTAAMLKAASDAMTRTGFIAGTPAQVRDQKHAVRYTAMIEAAWSPADDQR